MSENIYKTSMDSIIEGWRTEQERTFRSILDGGCPCLRCIEDRGELPLHMVVCIRCGYKRCPHATNHSFACTGSNEPGQEGSAYA